jgi:nucleoside-diphosphate-sugar epimerase
MLALKNGGIAGETFNIGAGVATTINQLARILLEITNKTHLEITRSKPRKGDIKHSAADISKAKEKLHYVSKVFLKTGLEEFVKVQGIHS